MKIKQIGKNVEEWEVTSHVHWPSLIPYLSIIIPSLLFSNDLLAKEERNE
jgi:hypothetical protein